jgi:hypothetical protein
MHPVGSSFIAEAGYDEESARMYVHLRDGSRYIYFMVPRHVFEDFLRADSQGSFLNSVIKPRYRVEQVA